VFYSFGAVAVATAGVNEIPPGVTVCFDEIDFATTTASGARSAIIGLVCSTGETATVYLYATTR